MGKHGCDTRRQHFYSIDANKDLSSSTALIEIVPTTVFMGTRRQGINCIRYSGCRRAVHASEYSSKGIQGHWMHDRGDREFEVSSVLEDL